jgi:RimJ/RimL family protein N-acetyltransferase
LIGPIPARNLQHWADHGYGLWILRPAGGADPIGRAVLRHLDVEGVDEVEVGYAVYPAAWGRGLATEAATACLAFGRRHLHLTTIVGVTKPSNRASQRVLVKAGLTYERDFLHEDAPASLFRVRYPTEQALPFPFTALRS